MSKTPKRPKSHVASLPVSTRQREQRKLSIALVVIAVAVALSLGALGYSYLAERVFPLQEPVARVALADGPPLEIRRGQFHARVRFERARYIDLARQDAQAAAQLADTYGFGQMALDQIMREALVRQEAARRGLTASEAEIDRYIEQAYGVTDPSGLQPTRTAFEKKYRDDLRVWGKYGINEAAFRDIVRAQVLETKLREAMADEPFQAWLDGLQTYMTWLDGWEKDIPKEPAWP